MKELFKKIILVILRYEAELVLRKHKPHVIGITGSVGKTSTKEAVYTMLKDYYRVWKSPKSYNSDLGVPLAILGLESAWSSPAGWLKNIVLGAWRVVSRAPYPEYLVLEMGIDRPGDLDKLLSWVHPGIAVATAVGEVPVHVEFFSSPKAVAEEKAKLIYAVPEDGVVILNGDDELVRAMREKTKAKIMTFGFGKDALIRASHYKMLTHGGLPHGMTFKIDYDGKTMPIKVEGIIGEQNVYALLGAAAVGLAKGLNLIEVSEALARFESPQGRFKMIEGIHDTLLFDDSYNASPLAVSAALHVLGTIGERRKVAILGDMLELGKFTPDEHRKIGEQAADVADLVIAVGIRAKFFENKNIKQFIWFANSEEAARKVPALIQSGDIVLIKGSQGVRMERITKVLMRNQDEAKEKLVRQDEYWTSQ